MSYARGLKKAAIGIATTTFFSLGLAFNAQADTTYDPAAGISQEEHQMNMLKPYMSAIEALRLHQVGATCCNKDDARVAYEEIINTPEGIEEFKEEIRGENEELEEELAEASEYGPDHPDALPPNVIKSKQKKLQDNKNLLTTLEYDANRPHGAYPYIVLLRYTLKGEALKTPYPFYIDKHKVLNIDYVNEVIKDKRLRNPQDKTLTLPPFNTIYYREYVYSNSTTPSRNLFCYYPIQAMN